MTSEVAAAVGFGKVLERDASGLDPADDGPWAVLDEGGELLAVYEAHTGTTGEAVGGRRARPTGGSPALPA